MKSFSKALIGTVAAGAMAMGAASPAQAQWRDRDRNDGIDAGDIIAGALIIEGIAAIASAAGNDRGRNDQYDRNYRGADNSRQAVEQCYYSAEQNASRSSRAEGAKATYIRNIKRKRHGYYD